MGTKTLYVSEHDEQVWQDARTLGGDSAESLSRLATEGLRLLMAERSAAAADGVEDEVAAEDAKIVDRFARELRKVGWRRAGQSFARACLDYGAARSRAKRKADVTLGTQGRQAAARKAQQTKGPVGRRKAAEKAWHTRKA